MTHYKHLIVGAALVLAGCQSTLVEVSDSARSVASLGPTPLLTLGALGAAAYYVVDPLAPNWEVAQTQLEDSRIRIDMRLKRFHSGGEGEAQLIFKRHAEELALTRGHGEYKLLAYSEGIDSEITGPRRWTRGVIDLTPARTSVSNLY